MEDRVATKPNRYAVYDDSHNFLRYEYHERADEPTQVGTPINKANLLSDTTAAALASAIGMTLPTTVNEALAGLAIKPIKIVTGYRNGTNTYGSSNPSSITFSFSPKIIIVAYIDSRYPGIPKRDAYMDILMDSITTSYVNNQLPSKDGNSAPSTWSKKSADGKTFYWYNTSSAMGQFNATGDKVYYLAIG